MLSKKEFFKRNINVNRLFGTDSFCKISFNPICRKVCPFYYSGLNYCRSILKNFYREQLKENLNKWKEL